MPKRAAAAAAAALQSGQALAFSAKMELNRIAEDAVTASPAAITAATAAFATVVAKGATDQPYSVAAAAPAGAGAGADPEAGTVGHISPTPRWPLQPEYVPLLESLGVPPERWQPLLNDLGTLIESVFDATAATATTVVTNAAKGEAATQQAEHQSEPPDFTPQTRHPEPR
jgi:hypothetical protein